MSTSPSQTTYQGFLLSLPATIAALRVDADRATAQADRLQSTLQFLDQGRLNSLTLTGDRRLDAALRLSMETGHHGGQHILAAFPRILEKITNLEQELLAWPSGGFMLLDVTSQAASPACLQFVLLQVPANPTLQFLRTSGYFHDIPFGICIPGRVVCASDSNTMLDRRFLGISAGYEVSPDERRAHLKDFSVLKTQIPPTAMFDAIVLFHPEWGPASVSLAGVTMGTDAILKHLERWKEFFRRSSLSTEAFTHYLTFLREFASDLASFERALQ